MGKKGGKNKSACWRRKDRHKGLLYNCVTVSSCGLTHNWNCKPGVAIPPELVSCKILHPKGFQSVLLQSQPRVPTHQPSLGAVPGMFHVSKRFLHVFSRDPLVLSHSPESETREFSSLFSLDSGKCWLSELNAWSKTQMRLRLGKGILGLALH